MQFLAIIRRRTESFSDEQFNEWLEAEAEFVRAAYIAGSVRSIWSRGDMLGAVLHLEAESEEAARALLDDLPLNRRGMLEIQMFIPLRGYRGFGPRG